MSALCSFVRNSKRCVRLVGHEGAHNAGDGDEFVEWYECAEDNCRTPIAVGRAFCDPCQAEVNRNTAGLAERAGLSRPKSGRGQLGRCMSYAPVQAASTKRCQLPAGHEGRHTHNDMGQAMHWPTEVETVIRGRCLYSVGGGDGYRCNLEGGHDGDHEPPDNSDVEAAAGKQGVVMLELVDLDFVTDMALQLTEGLNRPGRVPNGWQDLDPRKWRDKCAGAALRHMTAARRGYSELDPETGATHWAAVAVNAMMCWWFERLITRAKRADNEEKSDEDIHDHSTGGQDREGFRAR